ncbi:MAG: hypothetical protein JWN04_2708 [Myxococcaceae bacterium]|nr:hypothetical protein [Myxococcaceae bacterium]
MLDPTAAQLARSQRFGLILALLACAACRREAQPEKRATPAKLPSTSSSLPDVPAVEPAPAQTWQDICRSVAQADFPASDRPSAEQKASIKLGDSKRYYYGIGVPSDYAKARAAAFAELDAAFPGAFLKDTILTMIYANGLGVARNTNLATKLACDEGGSDDEMASRIQRLQQLSLGPDGPPFDVCQDASSGMMTGACEALEEEKKAPSRGRAIMHVTAGWPLVQKQALSKLQRVADAYWSAHATHEIDTSSLDSEGWIAHALAEQQEAFARDLERFASAPRVGDAESYARADAELNRVYKQTLATDWQGTSIEVAGIRATEKRWLGYRDAWVELGRVRYPDTKPEAWKTWLSEERARVLEAIGR